MVSVPIPENKSREIEGEEGDSTSEWIASCSGFKGGGGEEEEERGELDDFGDFLTTPLGEKEGDAEDVDG